MEKKAKEMKPEMIRKIDKILNTVKEPETLRPVSELNLVKKVTYSESMNSLTIVTDIDSPKSTCMVCGVVTENIRQSLQRQLQEAFSAEFPELTIEVR